MNEKVTLEYLIEALIRRHQMEPEDAGTFVNAFFEQIRRALERDKYIKVKGLGTFKRIEADVQENADAEERSSGQIRFRITFTPDVSMRDLINKPFAHFETVVLNENTHFDDMDEDGVEHVLEESGVKDESADETCESEEKAIEAESSAAAAEKECSSDEGNVTDEENEGISEGTDEGKPSETVTGKAEKVAATGEWADPERTQEKTFELSDMNEEEPERTEKEITESGILPGECVVPLIEPKETVPPTRGYTAPATGRQEEHAALPHEADTPVTATDPVKQDAFPAIPEYAADSFEKKTQKEVKNGIPWCMYATILLVGVLIGGGIIWALLSGRRYIPEPLLQELVSERKVNVSQASAENPEAIPVSDTIPALTPAKIDSVSQKPDSVMTKKQKKAIPVVLPVASPTEKPVKPKEENKTQTPKRETLADTVEYTIVGTLDTYTLQDGESLVKVASKYYGNKKLWPYIVRHNRKLIKNPDNVPVGTVLQIPKLSPKNNEK